VRRLCHLEVRERPNSLTSEHDYTFVGGERWPDRKSTQGAESRMIGDHNLRRVFLEAFCVQDIARPLPSFDACTPCRYARSAMAEQSLEVAGIRTQGLVTAFVEPSDLADGDCGAVARPLAFAQTVAETLPLAELVLRLNENPRLFVQTLGQVGGLVTRADIQSPPARMWLFGMVTLLEMRFGRLIEQYCPSDAWTSLLSEGRLLKAQALMAERQRRGQPVTLLDCLQFADKVHLIAAHEPLRGLTRFESKRQVESVGKQLENLRNSLAHAQDLVRGDWDTIVALAGELDAVLSGPPGLADR